MAILAVVISVLVLFVIVGTTMGAMQASGKASDMEEREGRES